MIESTLRTLHARIQLVRVLSLSAPDRGGQTLAELREVFDAVNARRRTARSRRILPPCRGCRASALHELRRQSRLTRRADPRFRHVHASRMIGLRPYELAGEDHAWATDRRPGMSCSRPGWPCAPRFSARAMSHAPRRTPTSSPPTCSGSSPSTAGARSGPATGCRAVSALLNLGMLSGLNRPHELAIPHPRRRGQQRPHAETRSARRLLQVAIYAGVPCGPRRVPHRAGGVRRDRGRRRPPRLRPDTSRG